MGTEASLVEVDANDEYVDLSGKGMKSIAVKIPFDAKTQVLNLNQNQLRELPPGVFQLRSVSMQRNGLQNIPDKIISALKTYPLLEKIDFSNNQISIFPPEIFEINSLKNVYLFGNKLSELEINSENVVLLSLGLNEFHVLPKLPKSIQVLDFDNNKLKVFSAELPNLLKLSLNYNKLRSFGETIAYPALVSLSLSNNKITTLPRKMDRIFPKLKNLDISYNQIKDLGRLPRAISDLRAQNNKIEKLPENIKTYTCLCRMNLANNSIQEIPSLPSSLQSLNLVNNKLKRIDYNHVQDLAHLYVMNNELDSMPKIKSQQLNDYFCCYNMIKEIRVDIMTPLTIRFIDLSFNSITTIPDDLFKLPIFALVLPGNNIKTISNKISTMSSLSLLNLSYNPIESLPLLPESLEELHLANCKLTQLDPKLQNLENLYTFNASCNNLCELPPLKNVVYLNLSKNNFVLFPEIPETVEYLDISFNALAIIPDSYVPTKLKVFDISNNILSQINSFAGYTSLERLQIHNNPIKSVLELNTKINYLDISGTKLRIDPEGRKPETFISKFLPESINLHTVKVGVAYTITVGKQHRKPDIIICKADVKPGISCFGITDNRRNHEGAFLYSSIIYSLATDAGYFGKDAMQNAFTQALNHMNTSFQGERIFTSLVAIKSDGIVVGTLGLPVIIASNTEVTFVGNHYPFYTMFTTKNGSFCHLGEDKEVAKSIVYNVPAAPNIESRAYPPNAKYLVLASRSVLDSMTEAAFLEIISKNETAENVVAELKSRTITALSTDNISIIVADLRKVFK